MPKTPRAEKIYFFEEFRLEPDKRSLFRLNDTNEQVRLSNRPFQVLLYLIENRDRFVSRDELLEKFWDGRDVYDTALTKAVGAVRKALQEPHENPRFIETRWAEGYRFIGDIAEQPVYLEIERTREVKVVIEDDCDAETRGHGDAGIQQFALSNFKSEISDSRASFKSEISDSTAGSKNLSASLRPRVSASPRLAFIAALTVAALLLVYGLIHSLTQTTITKNVPQDSIAVLPLKNLSGNAERDVFVDGMTESLISSLSKIKGLKVISRNSSFMFKDKNAAPREIAERLGVAAYLEGSFRESSGKIRVEVRLVNASNGEILWSGDSFERTTGDVFEIQDDIARRVATRLRLKLSAAEEQTVVKRHTSNVEAYENYVKGRFFWKKKTPGDLAKARKFFERAIALDPNYAAAYAGLADYWLTGIWYANFPPDEAIKNAKPLFEKVLQIDSESAEAHLGRARIAESEWDWETSRREIEKTLELNPNEANYWQSYAFVLRNYDANYDEAVTAIRRAAELDPLSASINTDVGVMLTHAGRYDEAIEKFNKTLETEPQFADAYWNLGLAFERKGDAQKAVEAFIQSERLKGTKAEHLNVVQTAFNHGGMPEFWGKWLEFLQANRQENEVPELYIAAFSARAGQREAAFEALEKSFAKRELYLVNLKTDFAFDSLRSDARFTDLLKRVGLEK